jgi:hypothetical protein
MAQANPYLQFVEEPDEAPAAASKAGGSNPYMALIDSEPDKSSDFTGQAARGIKSGWTAVESTPRALQFLGQAQTLKGIQQTLATFDAIDQGKELPKPREIEEILKDDDMTEHRQLILELRQELDK